MIRLMDKILHDPKDPKLWELWYIPYNGSCRILSINSIYVFSHFFLLCILTKKWVCNYHWGLRGSCARSDPDRPSGPLVRGRKSEDIGCGSMLTNFGYAMAVAIPYCLIL